MQQIQITLRLPDDLAREAGEAGLLDADRLARLIESELARRQMAEKYAATLDALGQLDEPMTPDEIDAELASLRAEKALRRDTFKY
jgi:hypothetical protein